MKFTIYFVHLDAVNNDLNSLHSLHGLPASEKKTEI